MLFLPPFERVFNERRIKIFQVAAHGTHLLRNDAHLTLPWHRIDLEQVRLLLLLMINEIHPNDTPAIEHLIHLAGCLRDLVLHIRGDVRGRELLT